MKLTKKQINAVIAFCGYRDVREFLNGVFFNGRELVATNGHVLVCITDNSVKKPAKALSDGGERIITSTSLKRLANALRVKDVAQLRASDTGVDAELADRLMGLDLIKDSGVAPGKYPDYEKVLQLLRPGLPEKFWWYQPKYTQALLDVSKAFLGGGDYGFPGVVSASNGMFGMDAVDSDTGYRVRVALMPMRL